ncbi:hypothetical protein MGH68_12085 [Erysipelothrix sp. D19-032]
MSNIIMRDSMGYPLRLCILNDGTQMWIDTYEEFIGEYDRDLKLISVDIPFGNIVFPPQRGIEE